MHLYYFCFFDCQVDFDVDIVQRRKLVNLYGYSAVLELLLLLNALIALSLLQLNSVQLEAGSTDGKLHRYIMHSQ